MPAFLTGCLDIGTHNQFKELATMKRLWMKTRKACLLLPALMALTSSGFATTYYVGTCQSGSYSTISAAVAAVPANSVIDVCPGTYTEQVFIKQPLTLQGIKSGQLERARLVPPLDIGGVIPWVTVPNPIAGELPIAPQIFVNVTSGTVKVSNLTVDASADTKAPVCGSASSYDTAGIVYQDSSGTITGDNTLGQGRYSGCGVGILAIASASNTVSVTITNNSVQDATVAGIKLEAALGNAGVKAVVTGNSVEVGSGAGGFSTPNIGINVFGVTGSVTSNIVVRATPLGGFAYGVWESVENDVGPLSISNNNFYGDLIGITVGVPTTYPRTVNGNRMVGVDEGFVITGAGGNGTLTLQGNEVLSSDLGFDLGCVLPILSGNTVNNDHTGVYRAPGGIAPAGIAIYNVDQRNGGGSCR